MEASAAKALRLGAGPAADAVDDKDAPVARPGASFTAVFLQLLPRIAGFMPRNEVACVLRLLCKAAAAALRGPQHATVHLSKPSPTAEFKWRWCGPQSLRSTTLKQRQQLEELTARSGVVANLEALAARGDTPLLSRPSSRWAPLLSAAAGAGRLEVCRWLHDQRGVQLSWCDLAAAAEGGHADVCEWLLDRGCKWDPYVVGAALRHGHVQLAERLLQLRLREAPLGAFDARYLLGSASYGCDLATLQRLHAEHIVGRGLELADLAGDFIAEAACGPTPDWAAKVEWLEGLGCPRTTTRACQYTPRCTDGAVRLAWLHKRGHELDAGSATAAAVRGNVEALRYVLTQGVQLAPQRLSALVRDACCSGSLAAVRVLWDAGGMPDYSALEAAAEHGHLHIVSWAVGQLGDGAQLSARLFAAAALSGSLPLLRWLHERGCPWDAGTWAGAAKCGSEEALEWLAEHGCPMGEEGTAYVAAAEQHDLPTLRCLARLGCPFAPDGGSTFEAAVFAMLDGVPALINEDFDPPPGEDFDPRPLLFLLDAGCPVDRNALLARVHVRVGGDPDSGALLQWLEQQWQQRS